MGGAHTSSQSEPMQLMTAAPAIAVDHSINRLLRMRKDQDSQVIYTSGTGAGQISYHVVLTPLQLFLTSANSHCDLTRYHLLHESRSRNFCFQSGDFQRPTRLLIEPVFRHLKKI